MKKRKCLLGIAVLFVMITVGAVTTNSTASAAHTHMWGSYSVTKNATCSSAGEKTAKCTQRYCYATNKISIPALGHSMGGWSTTKNATCTSAGTQTRRCGRSNCSYSETKSIAALGHSYGSYVVTTSATCTAAGKKTATCQRQYCYATTSTSIPALGHSMGAWSTTKNATCTATGTQARKCGRSNCSYSETKSIAALGHSFGTYSVTKKATCTTAGEKKATCSRQYCYATDTKAISATGHSYTGQIGRVEPTCTVAGYTGVVCNNCGNYSSKTSIPALGHSMGAWSTTKNATCTAAGTQARKCGRTNCSYSETNSIAALGHSFGTYSVTKKATCTTAGEKKATCSRQYCYATDTKAISATGHSYTGQIGRVEPTCTVAGYTGVVCNNCGNYSSKSVIPAKGHVWQTQSVVKKATCVENGAELQVCAVCLDKRTVTIKAPGTHSFTGQVKTVNATCTKDGYTGVVCNNCGIYSNKKVIPAKGHNYIPVRDGKLKCTSCSFSPDASTFTVYGVATYYFTAFGEYDCFSVPGGDHFRVDEITADFNVVAGDAWTITANADYVRIIVNGREYRGSYTGNKTSLTEVRIQIDAQPFTATSSREGIVKVTSGSHNVTMKLSQWPYHGYFGDKYPTITPTSSLSSRFINVDSKEYLPYHQAMYDRLFTEAITEATGACGVPVVGLENLYGSNPQIMSEVYAQTIVGRAFDTALPFILTVPGRCLFDYFIANRGNDTIELGRTGKYVDVVKRNATEIMPLSSKVKNVYTADTDEIIQQAFNYLGSKKSILIASSPAGGSGYNCFQDVSSFFADPLLAVGLGAVDSGTVLGMTFDGTYYTIHYKWHTMDYYDYDYGISLTMPIVSPKELFMLNSYGGYVKNYLNVWTKNIEVKYRTTGNRALDMYYMKELLGRENFAPGFKYEYYKVY